MLLKKSRTCSRIIKCLSFPHYQSIPVICVYTYRYTENKSSEKLSLNTFYHNLAKCEQIQAEKKKVGWL